MLALVVGSLVCEITGRFWKKVPKIIAIFSLILSLILFSPKDFLDLCFLVFLLVGISVCLYSSNVPKEFYPLLLLFLYSVRGVIIEKEIFHSFIFLEIASLISYFFVLMGGGKRRLKSCFEYFCFGEIGSLLILWGIALKYFDTILFSIFFTLGCMAKAGIFPFSFWLPNAHADAKSEGSVVLSGIMVEVICLFFLKFSLRDPLIDYLVILSCIATSFFSLIAFFEMDPKRILAYSTLLNISPIFLLSYYKATSLVFLWILYHSISKSLSFQCIGKIIKKFGRSLKKINGKELIFSSIFLIFSILTLMGFPITLGFFSKLSLCTFLNLFILVLIFLSFSLFSYPYLKILESLQRGEKNVEKIDEKFFANLLLFIIGIGGGFICMNGF